MRRRCVVSDGRDPGRRYNLAMRLYPALNAAAAVGDLATARSIFLELSAVP